MSANVYSIGLTGGIGSGKTTIGNMFAAKGIQVIDTDQIAHDLTAPAGIAIPAIRQAFGESFLTLEGAMDRAKMRSYVFSDPAQRKRLEAILHPLIQQEAERAGTQSTSAYLMFIVPLLLESGHWKQRVSRVLVIDCPEELQIERVMQRNNLTAAQVRAIIATQIPRTLRLAAADDIIVNMGDIGKLTPQVDKLHTLYTSLAGQNKTNSSHNL